MKTSRRLVIYFLVAASFSCAAAEVMAQFPGGGGTFGRRGGARGGEEMARQNQRPAAQENLADLVEFRLNVLQEDLKLSTAQEPAWASFSDRIRALISDISRERGRMQSVAQLNAEKQVDHAVDIARDRLAAFEDIASTGKALYATLTPEQRTLADSRMATIVPILINGATGPTAGGASKPRAGK
jgi:protein CpxP